MLRSCRHVTVDVGGLLQGSLVRITLGEAAYPLGVKMALCTQVLCTYGPIIRLHQESIKDVSLKYS
jgi:hypothetical protein